MARVVQPLQRFLDTEAASGVLLLAAALVALVWANSPGGGAYHRLSEDLAHWVNDLLMSLFFFVVGLEIKRELVHGELRDPRAAMLPVVCAAGGMIAPAVLYLLVNAGGPGSAGWGIPMATDIAFAVGVLALVGRWAPASLRVFLLTLAIVDDIGAILVIAVFYTADLSVAWLAASAIVLAVLVAMRRLEIRALPPYVVAAAVLWLAVYESGVHATIAGVALGLLTPAGAGLERLESRLHPWSAYVVLPLFALTNAGVEVSADALRGVFAEPVTLGVVLGLVAGKPIGIAGAAALAVRSRRAVLPPGIDWWQLVGVGLLGGIGFTVAIFVAGLAFAEPTLTDAAKVGILAASVVAGALGAVSLLLRGLAAGPR